ncbi:unnamed protein product [Closterium sp. Yama58-4]|nr:unnamed protein product [Closterium sp. Yama58-4]
MAEEAGSTGVTSLLECVGEERRGVNKGAAEVPGEVPAEVPVEERARAAGVLLADPGAAGVLLADPGAAGVLLADPGAAGARWDDARLPPTRPADHPLVKTLNDANGDTCGVGS